MRAFWPYSSSLVLLSAAEKLTVYSGRAERLIKPVLDEFSSKTGVQVDLLSSGTTELVNRLKAEGDRTTADLFLTNDAGSLEQARVAGILRPLNMREIERAIPPQFRAPDNAWIGLSGRFWIIVYNKTLVKPGELKSLLELGDPKWKDKIAIPNAGSEYLQAGVSVIRATHGDAKTKQFLEGLKENAGGQVYQKSSQIVEAVAKGQASVRHRQPLLRLPPPRGTTVRADCCVHARSTGEQAWARS